MTEERALAVATWADCAVLEVGCGVVWGDVETGEAAEDEGEAI